MGRSQWCAVLALAWVPAPLSACLEHAQVATRPTLIKAEPAPFQVSPVISGSWFDPARSGEGFVLQMLPDGRPLVFWFTYPPAGEPGEQAWLIAQGGVVDGNSVLFPEVLRPVGGRYGAAFDPAAVQRLPWGELRFTFEDCGTARVDYRGPVAWGSGTRELQRLTALDQLDCNVPRTLEASGAPALAGLRARSGAWFVPARSGEGWMVEELGNGQSLVYTFTYTPDGQQAWTVGQATREGTRVVMGDTLITRGTRFGEAFDAAAVERLPWGTLELDFVACDQLRMRPQPQLPGWQAAAQDAVRLTEVAGVACVDGTPAPPSQTRWVERARMPQPWTSELAVTALDGALYALGGFGGARSFRRFDPAGNTWSVLPDLPGGRDHLAAYALDGQVVMTGGADDGTNLNQSAHAFDVAAGVWRPLPELPFTFGSHAAVIAGKAYVGDVDGSLLEHDQRNRRMRRIAPMDGTARDHSQVVAFLGEVWMIAGRSPETNSVAIYDPARGQWRRGPALRHFRGGFAAAAAGPHLLVTGGEVFSDGIRLETRSEIYTAGQSRWVEAAPLPVPVHGTAAATVDGKVHVVSGSTRVGEAIGATGRLYALELGP